MLCITNGLQTLCTVDENYKITIDNVEYTLGAIDVDNFLTISSSALLGITVSNNLTNENQEVKDAINELLNSEYAKTYIFTPSRLFSTKLEDIKNTGAAIKKIPCLLSPDGYTYIPDSFIEQYYNYFQDLNIYQEGGYTFNRPSDLEEPVVCTTKNEVYTATTKPNDSYPLANCLNLAGFIDYLRTLNTSELLNQYKQYANFQITDDQITSIASTYPTIGDAVYALVDRYNLYSTLNSGRRVFRVLIMAGYPIRFLYSDVEQDNIFYKVVNFNNEDLYFVSYNNTYNSLETWGGLGIDRDNNMSQYAYIQEFQYSIDNFYPNSDTPEPSINNLMRANQQPAVIIDGLEINTDSTHPAQGEAFNTFLSSISVGEINTTAPATLDTLAHTQRWLKIAVVGEDSGYSKELNSEDEVEPISQADTLNSTTEETGTTTIINNNTTIIKEQGEVEQASESRGESEGDSPADETLPSIEWNAAGLTGIYNPSKAQLQSLMNFLWSSSFVDSIAKYFLSPSQAIISLGRTKFPVSVSGTNNIILGALDSGISSNVCNMYGNVTSESIAIPRQTNNYLDYQAQMLMYVPYLGFISLDARQVFSNPLGNANTIHLEYRYNVMTGTGIVEVILDVVGDPNAQIQTKHKMIAQGGINIMEYYPVSSYDASSAYLGGLNTAVSTIGGAVAGGAAGAAAGLGQGLLSNLGNFRTGASTQGGLSGNASLLSQQIPFIHIIYQKETTAENKIHFTGGGIDASGTVSNFKGYTKIDEINLDFPATDDEKDEIRTILNNGIYL